MTLHLNHGKEFVALCVEQIAADSNAPSSFLTRPLRSRAQATAERRVTMLREQHDRERQTEAVEIREILNGEWF